MTNADADHSIERPSTPAVWLTAARPKTLWVGAAPVIVGTSLAYRQGGFVLPYALAALLGAVLIQVGANFANDLFDYRRGADRGSRVGPLRVTQAGWVSPAQMQHAVVMIFALALADGICLTLRGGWPIVAVGLASMAAAVLYTGGPRPFGYHGLGDFFVFIFFGPVAVVGTYYVQTLSWHSEALFAAIPMGALATAVLVVNNLRDIDSDRAAGKRTLAVRLGYRGTIREFELLIAIAFVIPALMVASGFAGVGLLLPAGVALAGMILLAPRVRRSSGPAMNRLLARTAQLEALYAFAFALGIHSWHH